ncbi:hypothetical protein ACFLS8_00195 [Chloroflexota bacterium]
MEAGEGAVISDLKKLALNCISFAEMREMGYTIPAQGSIQNIRDEHGKDILIELIEKGSQGASQTPCL